MQTGRSLSHSPAGAVRDARAPALPGVGKPWSVVVCMSVRARCLPGLPSEGNGADQTGIYYTQQHRSPPATTAATTPQSRVSFSSLVVSWRRPRLRSLSVWWLVVTRCLLAWAGPERLGERRDTHPGVFWMVRTFLLFRLHHAAKAMAVVVAAEMPSIPVSDGRGDHLTRTHTPT